MATLEEILDQQVDEVKVPPPLPTGMYLCIVDGLPQHREIGANQTKALDFNLKILQPTDNVSQDEINAIDGGVVGKNIRARFFLTENAVFMLDRFLIDHLGVEKGRPRKQMIADAVNRQVYATIRHTPRDDGQGFYANLGETAKV